MSMSTIKTRILQGFESSSRTTPEFSKFYNQFKKEFTKELLSIKATNITFSKGHFYISGFFTVNNQPYYFSISDVRFFPHTNLLYRTAKNYKDFTGGTNQYSTIEDGMAQKYILKYITNQ
jgi:hypothetical protein